MNLPEGDSLSDIQTYIKAEFLSRGFSDETVSQKFMLLMEECGEFAQAARKSAGVKVAEDQKLHNLQHEAGDVLMVFLDICNTLGINANTAFRTKEEQNKSRNWA